MASGSGLAPILIFAPTKELIQFLVVLYIYNIYMCVIDRNHYEALVRSLVLRMTARAEGPPPNQSFYHLLANVMYMECIRNRYPSVKEIYSKIAH